MSESLKDSTKPIRLSQDFDETCEVLALKYASKLIENPLDLNRLNEVKLQLKNDLLRLSHCSLESIAISRMVLLGYMEKPKRLFKQVDF